MNNPKKIALLSLIFLSFFIPQHAHAIDPVAAVAPFIIVSYIIFSLILSAIISLIIFGLISKTCT